MIKQTKAGSFIQKLSILLNNHDYSHIITWDHTQKYIDILDPQVMQTEITPNYFRHTKFQSFVRQLNLYGFKKVKYENRLRFTHSLLLNGQPLTSITTYKNRKTIKRDRESTQSSPEQQRLNLAFQNEDIHRNSIEQREQRTILIDKKKEQRVLRNQRYQLRGQERNQRPAYLIPADYWQWMMSMMSNMQQPLNGFYSFMPITATPSQ